MKYERFEDLPVWGVAVDLAQQIYRITRDRFFAQPGDLRDQLRRAALSVSNNIAEGFERGSTSELLAFLYIARGSAGEVRSMLHFVDRCPEAAHLKSEISNLKPNPVPGKSAPGPRVSRTPILRASAISMRSPDGSSRIGKKPMISNGNSRTSFAGDAPRSRQDRMSEPNLKSQI